MPRVALPKPVAEMTDAELRAVIREGRRGLASRMRAANAVRRPAFRELAALDGAPIPAELQERLALGEQLKQAAKLDPEGEEKDALACVAERFRRRSG